MGPKDLIKLPDKLVEDLKEHIKKEILKEVYSELITVVQGRLDDLNKDKS